MQTPRILIAGLIAFAVTRSFQVFDRLPLRMMSHFDGSGHADGFMARADFFIINVIFAVGTLSALLALPYLAQRAPQLLNIPNRDYWLMPEQRERLQRNLHTLSGWIAVFVTALWTAVLELVLRANLHQQPLPRATLVLVCSGAVACGLCAVLWATRAFRVPDRA